MRSYPEDHDFNADELCPAEVPPVEEDSPRLTDPQRAVAAMRVVAASVTLSFMQFKGWVPMN